MVVRVGAGIRRAVGRLAKRLPDNVLDVSLRALDAVPTTLGTCVFERDWDVLIVLDGCRNDVYGKVVRTTPGIRSIASTSTVWMDRTFRPAYRREVAETAYLSANPYSHRLNPARFGRLEHVWVDSWDDDLGTVPPEPVLDRTIAVARDGTYRRVIAHFMQPHFPFIGDGRHLGRLGFQGFGLDGDASENVWRMVERGTISVETVIAAYEANLRYVFDAIKPVFDNVDGRVVITADHGNALGEWGMWGHRAHVPINALRVVPWDIYDARDEQKYEPNVDLDRQSEEPITSQVSERLSALGYTEDRS